MNLSVLIPTIPGRRQQIAALISEMYRQINLLDIGNEVEVIKLETPLRSAGGPTISAKRNELLSLASGKFIVMIDDDDEIHPEYFRHILDGISTHNNVVAITHPITVKYPNMKKELADVRNTYEHWQNGLDPNQSGGFHYKQPPYYKIPILRECYQGCRFNDVIRWGEDGDISRQLRKNMRGKPELYIPIPLYTYNMPVNINPKTRY